MGAATKFFRNLPYGSTVGEGRGSRGRGHVPRRAPRSLTAARGLGGAHDPLEFPGREPGAQGLLQVVGMIRSAIPDLHRDIQDQIVAEDRVVTRFVDRGTHRGELLGNPPTGRAIAVRGGNIETVDEDRIVEVWHLEDIAGLMAQIATTEPASGSGGALR